MDQRLNEQIRESSNEDEFIYENIEAPKFVDLRKPDLHKPGDDRLWFCTQFGCDLKHEDEIDPEAIYKSFVQRVMAFRSPNVRIKNAMIKEKFSSLAKCPKSVSPKLKVRMISPISKAKKENFNPLPIEPSPQSKLKPPPKIFSKEIKQSIDSVNKAGSSKKIENLSKASGVAKALVFSSKKKRRFDGFGDNKENEIKEEEKKKTAKPELKNTLMKSYSSTQRPTKIKPFRLRTDERGILKDNNTQNVAKKETQETKDKKVVKLAKLEGSKMVKSGVKRIEPLEDKQLKMKTSAKAKLIISIRHTVSSRQKMVLPKFNN